MYKQKRDSWFEDIEAALALPEGSEQELYVHAGRAVIRLSDIEKVLAFFCVTLYWPMNFEATKAFYAYRNFEARLNHVDSLVLIFQRFRSGGSRSLHSCEFISKPETL